MANQVQANPSTMFAPSGEKLLSMIAAADAKFEAARVRAREERRETLLARGLARAARGRHYDDIQNGVVR